MEIKIKGIYRHFKGNTYLIEDIAINTETNEQMVIYRALYSNAQLYARSYDMFLEKVDKFKYPDIKQKYRFELQKIKDITKQ